MLGHEKAGGFYTRELRRAGRRTGFEIVTLTDQRDMLATKLREIAFTRAAPFGQYRVNLAAIDNLAVPAVRQAQRQKQIVVLDEIGPMEILSEVFCQAVLEILTSPVLVIGTIVQRSQPFADRVKGHGRVTVKEVTPDNRDRLPESICTELAMFLDR